MNLDQTCLELAQRAREASRALVIARGELRNRWLIESAKALEDRSQELLAANAKDVKDATSLGQAMIDRLQLNPTRIAAMAQGMREIAALPDPNGRVLDSNIRPNGLRVLKVSVPLGVLFFLYESRPNVTVDAAGLAVKSGNAIILRGGKEAIHSNTLLHQILQQNLVPCGLPEAAVQLVTTTDREAVGKLLAMPEYIDLAIPRGGESLIRRVVTDAKMPVLKHFLGNCHVYVDKAADLGMAERIVINAKCQRPAVCNAMETLLIHSDVAEVFLPQIAKELLARQVELRGCSRSRALVSALKPASEQDFYTEFADLILAVKVVRDLDEALEHIAKYGSKHSDAIVTGDLIASERFQREVDSAAVLVNASTRFNDGFEIGLGAEIGISTDKFHARGPCGLQELCSYKYIILGEGQVRGQT